MPDLPEALILDVSFGIGRIMEDSRPDNIPRRHDSANAQSLRRGKRLESDLQIPRPQISYLLAQHHGESFSSLAYEVKDPQNLVVTQAEAILAFCPPRRKGERDPPAVRGRGRNPIPQLLHLVEVPGMGHRIDHAKGDPHRLKQLESPKGLLESSRMVSEPIIGLLQTVNTGEDAGQFESDQSFAILFNQAPISGQMYSQSLFDGEFDNVEDIFSDEWFAARNVEMRDPNLPHLANQPGNRFKRKPAFGRWMGRGFAVIAGKVTRVGQ